MANTVSVLSYANTFGDWVVTTNAVVKENNDLAANNYVKPTGTLYLNEPTLGLQVANNAVIAGQLQVQGIGSSAYIQNNLRVDHQVYLQNTTLSLVASGQANIGGPLLALSSGTGLAVSNNTTIGGTLNVSGTSTLSNTDVVGKLTVSDTSTLTGNVTMVDSLVTYNDIRTKNITANTLLTVPTANILASATIHGPTVISGLLSVGGNFFANDIITITNTLQSNSSVNTTTLGVTGGAYVNLLQANSSVNTNTLSVSSGVYANTIASNTSITSPKLSVNNLIDANGASAFLNTLQTNGQLSVGGNFIINGTTVYNTNIFTLSAASNNQISYFNVYRNGANASIRWNETSKYWDMIDVNNSIYYRILTTETMSDAVNSTSQVTAASSNAANILNNSIVSANNSMKSYVDGNVLSLQTLINSNTSTLQSQISTNAAYSQGVDNTQNTNISTVNTYAAAAYNKANTGGTFTNASLFQNDLTVSGNLIVNGTTTTVNSQTVATGDSLIKLAANNISSDVVDIGFYGVSNPSGTVSYHGLLREGSGGTSAGNFYLFKNLTTDPSTNTVNYSGLTVAKLVADGSLMTNLSGANITSGSVPNTALTNNTISGVALGGTLATLSPGSYITGSSYNGSGAQTFGVNATNNSVGSTVVARDGSGNFSANQITANAFIGQSSTTAQTNFGTLSVNSNTVLHAGNYNTYSPALNGANATGLWGISINGNAATASSVAWTNVSGRPTNVSSFNNDSGYLISSGTIQNANYASTYNINYSNRSNANYQILWGSSTQAYGTDLLFLNPSSGALYSYNNITAYYSDDRLKTRIGNIESALDKVSQLNGFLYVQNDLAESFGYQETGTQVGVSAQEVQKVQPEAVKLAAFDVSDDGTSKSGENYLTVQYDKLVPLLIEAIKELRLEIEELKKK